MKVKSEMKINGNTILVTGGGSGIGRALAVAFHGLGNQVIVAGRRKSALDEVTAAHPGMASAVLDIENPAAIKALAAGMAAKYPNLNMLINNAGIMRTEQLRDGDTADAEAMIAINLLGPIRLIAALLPQLMAQPDATIMNVSSGLAFLPLAMTPAYCATKAAIHSYTQSLRYQLKDSSVRVMELIPPYVQTELMGAGQASDSRAMPLEEFIAEVMGIVKSSPDAAEICVERVKPLRLAEANGNYDGFFKGFNEGMSGEH